MLLAVLVIEPRAVRAQDRTLRWRSIDVQAHLDSTGRLHVSERQAIVFTGDWNGAERRFDVHAGQRFQFERLSKVGASGSTRVLSKGDLSAVDAYNWADNNTLRWRSRAVADPPFNETELDYVLEYSYGNIMIPRDGTYLLDHDFVFADRLGDIERFTLALDVDDVWSAPAGFTGTFQTGRLPPGEGFVVRVPFTYRAAGRPASVEFGAGWFVRSVVAFLLVAGAWLVGGRLYRRESALDRFAPLMPPNTIDEAWLKTNVFHLLPEIVGAAWDDTTGAAEVAAVLARLVKEGKLKSDVRAQGWGPFRQDVLYLKLLVERGTLSDYERQLIDSLFTAGSDETDTASVRARYRKTGFDPASKIREPLQRIIRSLNIPLGGATKPSRWPTLALFATAMLLLVTGVISRPGDITVVFLGLGVSIVLYLWSMVAANAWQKRVEFVRAGAIYFVAPLAVLVVSHLALLGNGTWRTSPLTLAGLAFLALSFIVSVCNQASSRESMERIAFRRRLASARQFFIEQLRQQSPLLRDDWFPYLIAFGLGPQMDGWFHAFGGASNLTNSVVPVSSHSSSSGSSGSWTGFGGGGGFSGGGSSGSWAAAAGTMAAGVSAPSSSGSSGGGGGGGGSSGGGGGGGW